MAGGKALLIQKTIFFKDGFGTDVRIHNFMPSFICQAFKKCLLISSSSHDKER